MIIEKALKKNVKKLLAKENVVAVGIGFKKVGGKFTDEMAIICSVKHKIEVAKLSKRNIVPKTIKGIKTDIVETGEIKAFLGRTDRWRPAPPGVSVGHEWISAGTFGCVVLKIDGTRYILSNNHVLADSNNAPMNSPILQPGKADGGEYPRDLIARLAAFVPIKFIGDSGDCKITNGLAGVFNFFSKSLKRSSRLAAQDDLPVNLVDAAIATPTSGDKIIDNILEIGPTKGIGIAALGTAVKKSGRTTGLTHGVITQINVSVQVQYGGGKVAFFENQLMAGDMSAPGDSGSAVLDDGDKIIGLLFAGSDTSTIINPIQDVFELLEVTI